MVTPITPNLVQKRGNSSTVASLGMDSKTSKIPTRTRRELYEAIEAHHWCLTPSAFESQISCMKEDIALLLDYYKSPSASSKDILDKGSDKSLGVTSTEEMEFVYRLSSDLGLDEIQSLYLLRSTIRSELQSPDALAKLEWKSGIQYDNQLLDLVRNHYFIEREATLLLISALCRASMYPEHPFYQTASDTIQFLISKIYASNETFEMKLISLFEKTISSTVPKSVQTSPDLAMVWAFQNLKEQKACLELLILIYYDQIKCSASSVLTTYNILLKYSFGMKQINRPLFDANCTLFHDQISHLCGVLAISILNFEVVCHVPVLGEKSGPQSLLHESPQHIADLHELIWSSLMNPPSSSREPSVLGLFALAWGSYVEILLILLNEKCNKEYRQLYQTFTQTHPGSHSAQFLTQYGYLQAKGVDYLLTSLKGPLYCDEDSNELAYRSIIKGFLTSFVITQTMSNLPDRDKLVTCTSLLFANHPGLCEQFWEQDYIQLEKRSLLEATRRLFPLEFSPFTQLLRSLVGDTASASCVIKLLQENFCFADQIRESDYELSFDTRPGEIITWRGRNLVYGADRIPFAPPPQTPAHVIGQNVCILEFRYSTWHLFQSFLDSFLNTSGAILDEDIAGTVHLGTPSACLEIIQLFNTIFEHADSDVLRQLIDHLGETPLSSETRHLPPAERCIGLIGQVLNRCCVFSSPPIELITACIETFRILLPRYPRLVWKQLRAQQLLPQYSLTLFDSVKGGVGFSTERPVSYMQQVVLPLEAARGSYNATMSFLTLVKDLIQDARKVYDIGVDLDPRDKQLEKELSLASTHPSRLRALEQKLGGPLQVKALEQRLIEHRDRKEMALMQADVIYSCIVFIHNQIMSSFGSWRYQQLQQKFMLVVHALQIFQAVLEDTPTQHGHASSTSSQPGMLDGSSPLLLAYQFLCKTYIETASPDQLSPILDIAGLGVDSPVKFYRMHRRKEASALEAMILEALRFLKNALVYRLSDAASNRPTAAALITLDRILMNRTVEVAGKRMELTHAISTYISCDYSRDLPRYAIDVLTLLANVASLSQSQQNVAGLGQSMSFVGYFGEDAFTVVSTLVAMVDDEKLQSIRDPEIQESVYRFATVVAICQPALGAMFISGKSGQTATGSELTSAKTTAAAQEDIPETSLLHPILLTLKNWKNVQEEKPRVLTAIIRFLATLWESAKEHHGTLQKLRANTSFWDALRDILSTPQSLHLQDESSPLNADITSKCYFICTQAYTLRILALEGLFVSFSKSVPTPDFFKAVKSVLSGKTPSLFLHGPQFHYDPRLTVRAQDLASKISSVLHLADFQTQSWNDLFKSGRLYGDSYVYDMSSLTQRLSPHSEDAYVNTLLVNIRQVNINFSVTDAYIVLVRSWNLFCQMIASRLWNDLFGSDAASVMLDVVQSLIKVLREDLPVGSVTDIYSNEVGSIISFLTGKWIDLGIKSRKDLSLDSTSGLDPFVDLIESCTLAFETDRFSLGPAGQFSTYGFHSHLLNTVLLLLPALKSAATFVASDKLERTKDKLANIYPVLVPIIMQGFGFVMMGRDKQSDESGDHQFTLEFERHMSILSILVLQLIEVHELTVSPSVWHPVVERYEVLQLLLSSFSFCSQQVAQTLGSQQSSTLSSSRHLMLYILDCLNAFASYPAVSERLVVYGAMTCLCSNGLTGLFNEGHTIESLKEHNPSFGVVLQETWYKMLALVTRLIRALNHHPQILTESIGFIKLYETQFVQVFERQSHYLFSRNTDAQLLHAEQNASSPTIRLDELEELELITDLLYRYTMGADLIGCRGQQTPSGRDFAYVCQYQDFALHLLPRLAHLFNSPKELARCILGREHDQRETSNATEAEKLKENVTGKLIYIARNLLLFVTLSSNARGILACQNPMVNATVSIMADETAFSGSLVLHSSMTTFGDSNSATFGTIFDILRYNISTMQSYLTSPSSLSETIKKKDLTDQIDGFIVGIETAITFIISQLMILVSKEIQDGGQSFMMEDYASREIFAELKQTMKDLAFLLDALQKQAMAITGEVVSKLPLLSKTSDGSRVSTNVKQWAKGLESRIQESRAFLQMLDELASRKYH